MVSGVSSNVGQILNQLNVDMNRVERQGSQMSPAQLNKLMDKITREMDTVEMRFGKLNANSKIPYGMPHPQHALQGRHSYMGGSYFNGPGAGRGGSMANQLNQTIGLFNRTRDFINGGPNMPGEGGGGIRRRGFGGGGGDGGGGFGGNSGIMTGLPPKPKRSPGETNSEYQEELKEWNGDVEEKVLANIQEKYQKISQIIAQEHQTMSSIIGNIR